MKNYLKEADFNQNKHYQLRKTMFMDDRIMDDSRGSHNAVLLYMGIEDKIGLGENKHKKKGDASFFNDGQYFCVFPVGTAKEELRIKKGKYNQHKALLKEMGLIHFDEQEEKQSGYASRITYTPWDIWVKENGLYSDGEWIIEPTSPDFYNPSKIVTVQPNIVPKEAKIDPEPDELPSPEDVNEEQPINEVTTVEKYVEERSSISGFYSIILVEKTSDGIRHETNLMDKFKKASSKQILEFARKEYEVRQVEIPVA